MITPSPDLLTFLRLCLQSRWHPPALIEAETLTRGPDWDWEAATTAAMQGRVAPLLYDTLKGAAWVPGNVLQQLHRAYLFTAARAIALQRDLAELLNVLTEAGIPHIVLKGAVLGETVYGNVALRPFGDLDILVHDTDAVAAQGVAMSLGYAPIGTPLHRHPTPEFLLKEVHLAKDGLASGTNLDLHRHLFMPPVTPAAMTPDWFWDTAIETQIEKTSTLTLSPEAQIIYLSIHVGEQHAEGNMLGSLSTLLWLTDIGTLISKHLDTIDWEQVLGRSRDNKLLGAVRDVLLQLAQAWRVPIPDAIAAQLVHPDSISAKDRALRLLRDETPTGGPIHRSFFIALASIPNWRRRLQFVAYSGFPSAEYMRKRYKVPCGILLPIFYIYRLLFALRSLLLTLWVYFRQRLGGTRRSLP